MKEETKEIQIKNNINSEINKGFPDSSFFNIPIDLNFENDFPNFKNKGLSFPEKNENIPDNISQNYLSEDLFNILTSINSFSSNIDNYSKEILSKKPSKFSRFYASFKQKPKESCSLEENTKENSMDLNIIKNKNFLFYKEEKEKKEEKKICEFSNLKDFEFNNDLQKKKENINNGKKPIQNYNINIYNPYINYINISYSPSCSSFSSFSEENNKVMNENLIILNEKNKTARKLPLNFYYNNSKNFVNFNNSENNINFTINNRIKNLDDNFQANFSQINPVHNLLFNYNNNIIINNIKNDNIKENLNNINCNINENSSPKIKKNKKKKKKKIDDEYTIEMFGRRGWICEECNNFNYESRKKCNRCKITKKPVKKIFLFDNNGNKIIDNIINHNHKEDWICLSCGNVNYAFRLNCNRCQKKKEDSPKKNIDKNSFEN